MTTQAGGHLPSTLSTFVGRSGQTSEVTKLLADARLVTLTGPGGAGKTRLAQRAAQRVREDGGRSVTWFDLGPLSDPGLVPDRLAAVLTSRAAPELPPVERICRGLAGVDALLVLDTCEHVLSAVAEVAHRVLRGCPGVSVLATSRTPLGVDGEITWPIPPLTVPVDTSYDAVVASESGRLFVERARQAARHFELTDENLAAVAEICRRLDGLPLPIELAAARCRVLSPQRIARGLDDRFRLLASSSTTAEPRHRTLLASIDWSHALLTTAERAMFRAVAVFAGSFSLDGAVAVAAASDIGPDEALDLLTALVERSLVVADTSLAEPRYRLLDTVHAFARERLAASDTQEAVRAHHFDHVSAFVARTVAELHGPAASTALRAIDTDLDDIRLALEWSQRNGDAVRALSLTTALHWYWRIRAPLEGCNWTSAALDLGGGSEELRAAALVTLSSLEMMLGRVDPAIQHAESARDQATALGDDRTRGQALAFLGWLLVMRDRDLTAATAALEDAVATCVRAGDRPYESLAHNALGFSMVGLPPGRRRSRAELDQGMAIGRELGFERPLVEGQIWLGILELTEGEYATAEARLEYALAPDVWPWEPLFLGIGAATLAEVLTSTGRYDEASVVLDAAPSAVESHEVVVEASRLARGALAYVRGDLDHAFEELERAHAFLAPTLVREAARCEELLALVALRRGDSSMAIALAERCPVQARTFPYIRATAPGLQALALAHQDEGDPVTAADVWHELLEASAEVGHRPGVCDALDGLGGCLADLGRYDEAARVLGAVDAMRGALGYVRFPIDRSAYDEAVERVTAALGSDAFGELAATGAELSWDDAVSLVRRGRGARGRPSHGWYALTPTEHQVVALVAEGLTNPQIAERLFVSPRTVQSHLRHVFAKLDVATRAELAAQAVARGATLAE